MPHLAFLPPLPLPLPPPPLAQRRVALPRAPREPRRRIRGTCRLLLQPFPLFADGDGDVAPHPSNPFSDGGVFASAPDREAGGADDSDEAVSGAAIVAGGEADPAVSAAAGARRVETVQAVVAAAAAQRKKKKKAAAFIPFREDDFDVDVDVDVQHRRRGESAYASAQPPQRPGRDRVPEFDNASANGNAIDPASDDSIDARDAYPDSNELFFEGHSYPPDALEWCSTTDAEVMPTPSVPVGPLPYSPTAGVTRICVGDHNLSTMHVEQMFVDTFRKSSPYINAHQGLVFVIHIPGAIVGEGLFATVMEDIALMRVVGIKIVLVLGPQQQVTERLAQQGITSRFVNGIRVTDAHALQVVKEVAGSLRLEVECALATGVTNMPSSSRISVVGGNFFSAQPVGIIDGDDFGYTGKVRRIDAEAIHRRLDDGDIIVLSNVGGSPSGQQFNCKAEDVAAECAAQLKAEKLIFMGSGETLFDVRSDHTIPNLSLKTAARFLSLRADELPWEFRLALQCSVNALSRGVRRAHVLNRFMNGVLLMEVFHRDGVGLMVSRDLYEGFRTARQTDVNGVKAIIRPLEEEGILKRRSRTMLERDIGKFVVIERDGMIIACLSLTVMEDDPAWAELGCVAVHKDYRKLGKGDAMLGFTERMAFGKGVRHLFVLSTQSFDWFHERGFSEVDVEALPKGRQEMYDRSRRSKIFHKVLQGSRAVDEAEVLKHL